MSVATFKRITCGILKLGSTNAKPDEGKALPGVDGNQEGLLVLIWFASATNGILFKRVVSVMVIKLKSVPVLPGWLVNHTKGTRPLNAPTPPRTCKLLSPFTSQLNPSLGLMVAGVVGHMPDL